MPTRSFLRYWLPLIAYCALIFKLSSQPLPKEIPPVFGMDKLMHAAAWIFLGILFFRAFQNCWPKAKVPTILILSIAASVLFGISDEYHQSFVPSRTADIMDIFFDFLGSMVGAAICFVFYGKTEKVRPPVTRQ